MGWYFVPEDWQMSESLLKWTKDKGLTDSAIEDQLESFRDHQYKRPMMKPDACWRNWVKNGIRFGSIVPIAKDKVYNQPQELTDAQKAEDLRKWEDDMRKLKGGEMSRVVSWFSCGAASAVATKLTNPDVIAYCDTGSEDFDNKRFMRDCEKWFDKEITILKSKKYETTWDVWERRRYISGIAGAPCTGELKINPRLEFQRPDDIHVFGYTCDGPDIKRAESLREHWPELNVRTPLIDGGITKAACLAMIQNAEIDPPRTYAMGFPNANCIPCCKATSPAC